MIINNIREFRVLLLLIVGVSLLSSCNNSFMGVEEPLPQSADQYTNLNENGVENYSFISKGIKGYVYEKLSDGSLGNTISNVRITFIKDNGQRATAYTDSNGYFSSKLPSGNWQVAASKVGYEIDYPDEVYNVSGFGYQTAYAMMKKLDHHVGGITRGRPAFGNYTSWNLPGVKLTFVKDDGFINYSFYSSNTNGHYQVKLPPGKYSVSGEKEGYYNYSTGNGWLVVNNTNNQTSNPYLRKRITYVFPNP